MAKRMLKLWARFHHAPESVSEIGPATTFVDIEATSRSAGEREARAIAKARGWRFSGLGDYAYAPQEPKT